MDRLRLAARWIKKNRYDIWLLTFTIVVLWLYLSQHDSQIQGRKDRIEQDANLQLGEILVCDKALGALYGVLKLAVPPKQYKKLTPANKALIGQYFAIANPIQCAALTHGVVPTTSKGQHGSKPTK